MSKYDPLWNFVSADGREAVVLSFEEIEKIAGIPIDHSFLRYKKELVEYGYEVDNISMKERKVTFKKCRTIP